MKDYASDVEVVQQAHGQQLLLLQLVQEPAKKDKFIENKSAKQE